MNCLYCSSIKVLKDFIDSTIAMHIFYLSFKLISCLAVAQSTLSLSLLNEEQLFIE